MDAVNAARALRASKTVRDGCGHRRLARGGGGGVVVCGFFNSWFCGICRYIVV